MSLAYVETSWDLSLGRAIQLRREKIYCGNKHILDARGEMHSSQTVSLHMYIP